MSISKGTNHSTYHTIIKKNHPQTLKGLAVNTNYFIKIIKLMYNYNHENN